MELPIAHGRGTPAALRPFTPTTPRGSPTPEPPQSTDATEDEDLPFPFSPDLETSPFGTPDTSIHSSPQPNLDRFDASPGSSATSPYPSPHNNYFLSPPPSWRGSPRGSHSPSRDSHFSNHHLLNKSAVRSFSRSPSSEGSWSRRRPSDSLRTNTLGSQGNSPPKVLWVDNTRFVLHEPSIDYASLPEVVLTAEELAEAERQDLYQEPRSMAEIIQPIAIVKALPSGGRKVFVFSSEEVARLSWWANRNPYTNEPVQPEQLHRVVVPAGASQ